VTNASTPSLNPQNLDLFLSMAKITSIWKILFEISVFKIKPSKC
jgi:hypothetical protein